MQVVDELDVASAVARAVNDRLDGPYNLAPDGWIAPDTAEALATSSRRLALPERLARPVAALGRIVGIGRRTSGIDPYLDQPWVVANDKLRSLGWSPILGNEEAMVGAQAPSWWRDLSPRRRQEMALGVVGVGIVGAIASVVVVVVRKRRKHHSD